MDERRREQERRLTAGDDPAAEAALLAADLRVGRLTRERVDVAAAVGWPAAVLAVGGPAAWPTTPDERAAWLLRLERDHGREVLVRALAAIASRRWTYRRPGTTKRHQLLALDAAVEDLDRWAARGRKPVSRTRFTGPAGSVVNHARVLARNGKRGRLALDEEDLLAVRREVGAWALGREDAPATRVARREAARSDAGSSVTPTLAPGVVDHHRAFLRAHGGPKAAEDYGD